MVLNRHCKFHAHLLLSVAHKLMVVYILDVCNADSSL